MRLRFACAAPDGRRSLVWWVDARNGEVYVGAREIGWWKASLHPSGAWHLRADPVTPAPVTVPEDRFVARWQRSREMFPGVTAGLSIVIPHDAITEHEPCLKKVAWCSPPSVGHDVVFSVLLGAPRAQAQLTPDAIEAGISIVGELEVDADRRAWVLHWMVDQDEHEQELWTNVASDEARGDPWALWRFNLPDGREKIVITGENRTARASRYLAELVVPQ